MHLTAFVWPMFHWAWTIGQQLILLWSALHESYNASWTLHTLKVPRMSTHNSDFSQTNELNVKAQTNARMKKIWKMRYSLVCGGLEKIVSESFCWLLFTLCELKECRRLCSKTLFMRTTKPSIHFLGENVRSLGFKCYRQSPTFWWAGQEKLDNLIPVQYFCLTWDC